MTPGPLPAPFACRICDAAPDEIAGLVPRTVINLGLDDDLNTVREIASCQRLHERVKFPTSAHRFAAGHRIRLALGSSHWPLIWPPGRPARSIISTRVAKLYLPLQQENSRPLNRQFPPAMDIATGEGLPIRSGGQLWRCLSDDPRARLRNAWHQPEIRLEFKDIDVAFTFETAAEFGCRAGEAGRDTSSIEHRIEVEHPDGLACISGMVVLFKSPDGAKSMAEKTVTWNDVAVATLRSEALE